MQSMILFLFNIMYVRKYYKRTMTYEAYEILPLGTMIYNYKVR